MRDLNNYRLRAAPCAEASTATEDWPSIESRFRLWSFRVYYARTFAAEMDLTLRFAKALVASCQPIRDRRLVHEWHRNRQRQQRKHADTATVST